MKFLFYAFYVYALLVSLAYSANVIFGIIIGQASLYSRIGVALFIFSCVLVCLSIFYSMSMKLVCSMAFFICFVVVNYNDYVVNALFHSDNEGVKLFINVTFFILGYIVPAVGVVVSARLLMLLQHSRGEANDQAE